MVNLKINGIPVTVPEGTTVLEAAKKAGVSIPTLCYLKDINEIGACRVCVVQIKGARSLMASCVYPVSEGMEVLTHSPEVIKSRKNTLELILSTHDKKCLSCVRNQTCELQRLCKEYGVDEDRYKGEREDYEQDSSSLCLVRDNNKCILCRRCEAVCRANQDVAVIGANSRGFKTHIGCAFESDIADMTCVGCGQCIVACPTGALRERDDTDEVFKALQDENKIVIAGVAPSIRVTLGEPFGMPLGANVTGKMVTALRRLGFDKVFDVNFTADLTIMEEGTELLERLEKGGPLPLITSCSPGWVKYCEHYYPDMLKNVSSCKSPQQMFGAVAKTYYAKKLGVKPSDIFVVGIMPCTAKKFEAKRENQAAAGVPDVDVSLTTRELARMIKISGIDFVNLEDQEFDTPFGLGSGAGAIFGATGGVMEAALRTVAEIVNKKPLEKLEFSEVRGTEGIKEASYDIGGKTVNVAVASGLANARKLLDMIKRGEKDYHFVEIMACPGGCVNGGGQPTQPDSVRYSIDLREVRGKALYEADKNLPVRKSHENPFIKEIYKDFFGSPGSHLAHEYLHTTYEARGK